MAERNTVTEANSPDNAPPQPLLDDDSSTGWMIFSIQSKWAKMPSI